MSAETYRTFLEEKAHLSEDAGFEPLFLPDCLFPFQGSLDEWAIRKGRAALFADCGLGKTLMQLVWAENVIRKTNRPVLLLTPIAVGIQTVKEAEKFQIEAKRSSDGTVRPNITVTNYERLHYFSPNDFAGVVCDESSILKNFDGVTKAAVTEFLRKLPYRLLCTATAAPNDYIELGTSSEALGGLGYMDMLGMFFKNDQNSLHPSYMGNGWRFKPHAERPFWRWLCSWARALRKPSDLGFSDDGFILPPLEVKQTIVNASRPLDGFLFSVPAVGLAEQRQERKHTLRERCEAAAAKASHDHPVVSWCHLNAEGDLLEKLIPGAIQVSGQDCDEAKEEKLHAFSSGQARALVTKPSIAGFGLNWQHCGHQTLFPSHSFEDYYQVIRRSWRFGRTGPVLIDLITTEGEGNVLENLHNKAARADRMMTMMVEEMAHEMGVRRSSYKSVPMEIPAWLS